MRKKKCIEIWLDKTLFNRSGFINLLNTRDGKIIFAYSVIQPFTRRLDHLQKTFNAGKERLGYKTCIEETISARNTLISDIEDFLAMFYKKDYRIPIVQQILNVLNETKQFNI
jgi:hypothetical protein